MRSKIVLLVSILLWGAARFASANDIEPTKEKYTAIHTGGAITLDGKLTDWTGVPVLSDPKFATPKGTGPLQVDDKIVMRLHTQNPEEVLLDFHAQVTEWQ